MLIWVRGVNCHFIIINRSWTKVTHIHTYVRYNRFSCTNKRRFLTSSKQMKFLLRCNGLSKWLKRMNSRVRTYALVNIKVQFSYHFGDSDSNSTKPHVTQFIITTFPPGFLVATLRPRPTCQVGNSLFFLHAIVNPYQILLKYMKEPSRTAEKKLKLMHYDLHE